MAMTKTLDVMRQVREMLLRHDPANPLYPTLREADGLLRRGVVADGEQHRLRAQGTEATCPAPPRRLGQRPRRARQQRLRRRGPHAGHAGRPELHPAGDPPARYRLAAPRPPGAFPPPRARGAPDAPCRASRVDRASGRDRTARPPASGGRERDARPPTSGGTHPERRTRPGRDTRARRPSAPGRRLSGGHCAALATWTRGAAARRAMRSSAAGRWGRAGCAKAATWTSSCGPRSGPNSPHATRSGQSGTRRVMIGDIEVWDSWAARRGPARRSHRRGRGDPRLPVRAPGQGAGLEGSGGPPKDRADAALIRRYLIEHPSEQGRAST